MLAIDLVAKLEAQIKIYGADLQAHKVDDGYSFPDIEILFDDYYYKETAIPLVELV
jgi:hypothetical protein